MLVIIVAILILIIFWVYVFRKNSASNEMNELTDELTDEMEGSGATRWMSLYEYNNLYIVIDNNYIMCKMGGESSSDAKQVFFHEANERLRIMWNRVNPPVFSLGSNYRTFKAYIIIMSPTQITDDVAQAMNGNNANIPLTVTHPAIQTMKSKLLSWYGTFTTKNPSIGKFWSTEVDRNMKTGITNAEMIAHFLIQACECMGHVVIYRLELIEVGEKDGSATRVNKVFRLSHKSTKLEDRSSLASMTAMAYGWSNDNEACTMKCTDIINGRTLQNVIDNFIPNVLSGVETECNQFLNHMTGTTRWTMKFKRNDTFNDVSVLPAKNVGNAPEPLNKGQPNQYQAQDFGIYEMELVDSTAGTQAEPSAPSNAPIAPTLPQALQLPQALPLPPNDVNNIANNVEPPNDVNNISNN